MDAPLLAQGAKHLLEVGLHLGMSAVQHIPGGAAPTAVGDPLRRQRQAILPLHEPVRVLAEHLRAGLGDKGGDPERGLAAGGADLPGQGCHPLLELGGRGEPVPHFRLIAVVYLHVAQGREAHRPHRQVLANVGGAHVRVVVIPGAPATRARGHLVHQRRVLGLDIVRQRPQQGLPVRPLQADQRLALPLLSGGEDAPFGVHHYLEAPVRIEAKLPAKALTARERQQQPAPLAGHQQQVVHGVIAIVVRDAIDAGVGAAAHRLGGLPAAHGLGQHLEPLSVDGRVGREAKRPLKQPPVANGLGAGPGIVQPHPAQGAVPLTGLQQLGRQGGIGGQLAQSGQERGVRHGSSFL
ncbi:hypothetical protein D3C75_531980 [compost metagenome]